MMSRLMSDHQKMNHREKNCQTFVLRRRRMMSHLNGRLVRSFQIVRQSRQSPARHGCWYENRLPLGHVKNVP